MNLSMPQNGGSLRPRSPPAAVLHFADIKCCKFRPPLSPPPRPLPPPSSDSRLPPPDCSVRPPQDAGRSIVYIFSYVYICIRIYIYMYKFFFTISLMSAPEAVTVSRFFSPMRSPWFCIIQPSRCGSISREIEDTCNSRTNGLWKAVMNNRWCGDESWYLYFNWNHFVARGTNHGAMSNRRKLLPFN